MGRGSTATLGGGVMPKIYSVEPWDGKDGEVSLVLGEACGVILSSALFKNILFLCHPQLPVEEDYDLSDVDLDDDLGKDEL